MFDEPAAESIPEAVARVPVLPRPEQRPDLETYTVVVHDVPIRELLFSMARDAKLNLDIDNDIKGNVTMNAIATFAECGPLQCPDNPTSYWLFN